MDQSPTPRRDFLTGRAALQAAREWADRLQREPPADPASESGSGFLVTHTRRAMACDFAVLLDLRREPLGTAAAVEALNLVEDLESQLTVYRDTSEISLINSRAALEPVSVEPRLFALLQQARELRQATNGAYDITSGPLSDIWGFSRRQGRLPSEHEIAAALAKVGMNHVELSPDLTVRFTRPGVELNLGSIGKGYALDRCAELLAERGVTNYLLHGGNSSLLARGSPPEYAASSADNPTNDNAAITAQPSCWWFGIRDPFRSDRRLFEVAVRDRAVGTSGAAMQFFLHQGRRYGHILDPRTGWPAEGMLAVTVLAPTAAEADALSTACYILGRDRALEYLAQQSNLSAILFTPGKKTGQWELTTHNLEQADIRTPASS